MATTLEQKKKLHDKSCRLTTVVTLVLPRKLEPPHHPRKKKVFRVIFSSEKKKFFIKHYYHLWRFLFCVRVSTYYFVSIKYFFFWSKWKWVGWGKCASRDWWHSVWQFCSCCSITRVHTPCKLILTGKLSLSLP